MAQVAVCSQINTKHINTVWAERKLLNVKLLVHHVTSRLQRVNRGTVLTFAWEDQDKTQKPLKTTQFTSEFRNGNQLNTSCRTDSCLHTDVFSSRSSGSGSSSSSK